MDLPLILSHDNLSQYIPYLMFKYSYDDYMDYTIPHAEKIFKLDYKSLIETSCLISSDLIMTALINEKDENNHLYYDSVTKINRLKLIEENGKYIKICVYSDDHDFPGHQFSIILPHNKNIFYLIDSYIANRKITSLSLTAEKLNKLFDDIEKFSKNPTTILWENITRVKELYIPEKIIVEIYIWDLPHINKEYVNNNMEKLKMDGIKNTKKNIMPDYYEIIDYIYNLGIY